MTEGDDGGRKGTNRPQPDTTELTPRERSLANLRPPWQPGESGNLAGKPKSFSRVLREQATEDDLIAMCQAIIKKVKRGDIRAAEFVRDTVEGKPRVRVSLERDAEDDPFIESVRQLQHLLGGGEANVVDGEARELEPGE
jgi:hypothetical protein